MRKLRSPSPILNCPSRPTGRTTCPGPHGDRRAGVRRRGGFAGPVKISAEGLPAGVRAEPLEIAAGAPSGKLVLLSEATATPPGHALLKSTEAATSMVWP